MFLTACDQNRNVRVIRKYVETTVEMCSRYSLTLNTIQGPIFIKLANVRVFVDQVLPLAHDVKVVDYLDRFIV